MTLEAPSLSRRHLRSLGPEATKLSDEPQCLMTLIKGTNELGLQREMQNLGAEPESDHLALSLLSKRGGL